MSADDVSDSAGVSGRLASQIRGAFEQSSTARWVALVVGLVGAASAGRSLTKVLVVASALAWQRQVRPRADLRVVAGVVSLFLAMIVVAGLISRLRNLAGLGVATTSLVAVGVATASDGSSSRRASELYGSLGATLATLGVVFLFGRVLVAALVLNAVVWERFGSIASFVFGLPGLRSLPRRVPRLARFSGLEAEADGDDR